MEKHPRPNRKISMSGEESWMEIEGEIELRFENWNDVANGAILQASQETMESRTTFDLQLNQNRN
jgi:hypothetical protein